MARIVRLTSGLLPDQALAAASRRLQHSLHQCSTSGTSVAVGSIQLTHNMQLVCLTAGLAYQLANNAGFI